MARYLTRDLDAEARHCGSLRPIGSARSPLSEEQLQPLAKEALPEGVTWNSTYCAFAEHKAYCHWEAPTRKAVVEIFKKYEIPYEAIYEVRLFDPATGQLEAGPVEVTP